MAKVELPRMGTSMDDLIALAGEGALGAKRISTPGDFAAKAKDAKGRWFEAATAIARSLDSTFDAAGPVRQWIHDNRKDRHLSAVTADLEEELAWLLRPRFVWRAGFTRMRSHDRYLRGIRSRIGRISSLPLVKDLEKMERVRRYWQPWFIEWTKRPEDPSLWEYGWLPGEFRLSLFAPDIPVEMKVSEKRLAEGF
jgi:ATP-dependent helicase HrpA